MQIGDILGARYELRAALGAGGVGQVFRAFDDKELREVAVKIVDPARCSADAMHRHAAAATSAARTRHPAIVASRVEAAAGGEPPLVVSELVAGEDLDALRERSGPIPWRRATEIVETCAEALAAVAAATGAAHRALKPGNVRVREGEVRILDFGVAELGLLPVPPRGDVHVEYRAPEQLEGAPGDARSDVFTLGVLLFEMVTAVHPFSGPSTFKVMHRVLLQPAPRPSEVAPTLALPMTLEALLMRALARRPADRIADPAELGKLLALLRRASGVELAPAPARSSVAQAPGDETSLIAGAEAADDPSTVLRRVPSVPAESVAPPSVSAPVVTTPVVSTPVATTPVATTPVVRTLAVAPVLPRLAPRAAVVPGPPVVAPCDEPSLLSPSVMGPPLLTDDTELIPVEERRPPVTAPAADIADPSALLVAGGPPEHTRTGPLLSHERTEILPAVERDELQRAPERREPIDPTVVLRPSVDPPPAAVEGASDAPAEPRARPPASRSAAAQEPAAVAGQPSPFNQLVVVNLVLVTLAAAGLAWALLG